MTSPAGGSPPTRGWRYNKGAGRLEMRYNGTLAGFINASGIFSAAAVAVGSTADNVLFTLGTDADQAMVSRSTVLNANTALTGVIVGTPVTPAVAANSLIVGNVTADGDQLFVTQTGGNSHAWLWNDASAAITRIYAGAGIEVAKFSSAATTLTGVLSIAGSARFTTAAGFWGFGAPEAVTIATGVATITRPYVILDAEGAGTTDTLDSFTYTGAAAGDRVRFVTTATDTITFDNSVTMLLGAGTRVVAPGGYIDFELVGTTWQERGFLTASS